MIRMEHLIQHIWKYKLYSPSELITTSGIPFTVIDAGTQNTHAGPDFFNAKIKIKDKVWAGNIEIHLSSSDWYKHEHHKDDAYNSTIMHIVTENDCDGISTKNGNSIPQAILKVPETVRKNYEYLLHADKGVACLDRITEVSDIFLTDWKSALTIERLEAKAQQIYSTLEQKEDDWEETLYITLARNLGFGINGDAFERLARSLPLKYIQKHQDNLFQVEAMLFGQAGLLSEEEDMADPYYKDMQKEYQFLKNKFGLQPLDAFLFKKLRTRPFNFPHVKIAQLAAILHHNEHLFSEIVEVRAVDEYFQFFLPSISEYWLNHYHFQSTSANKSDKKMGLSALHIILINTVAPMLFAYGKRKKLNRFVDYALQLLETIPPERNSIITLFNRAGLGAAHAADSQAIIQLMRGYCEKKKCLFCRIGHKLLAKPEVIHEKII